MRVTQRLTTIKANGAAPGFRWQAGILAADPQTQGEQSGAVKRSLKNERAFCSLFFSAPGVYRLCQNRER